MHNWHLLVLLISSLLQPILSEGTFDGRQCCSHSSRVPPEEEIRSWRGKYGNLISSNRLNTPRENRLDDHRYEARLGDLRDIRFSDERGAERHSLSPHGYRQRYDERALQRSSVQDLRAAQRESILRQNDARNKRISLSRPLINRDKEVSVSSSPVYTGRAYAEEFRTSTQNIRKRDLTKDSDRIALDRRGIISERQELYNNRADEHSILQRLQMRETQEEVHSTGYGKNAITSKDFKDRTHVRVSVSNERGRDSRQIKDEHITSSLGRKLETDTRYKQANRVRDRKASVRGHSIDQKTAETLSREDIRSQTMFNKHDRQLSDARSDVRSQGRTERIDIRNLDIMENNNERTSYVKNIVRQHVAKREINNNGRIQEVRRAIRHPNSRKVTVDSREPRRSNVEDNRTELRSNENHRQDREKRTIFNKREIRDQDTRAVINHATQTQERYSNNVRDHPDIRDNERQAKDTLERRFMLERGQREVRKVIDRRIFRTREDPKKNIGAGNANIRYTAKSNMRINTDSKDVARGINEQFHSILRSTNEGQPKNKEVQETVRQERVKNRNSERGLGKNTARDISAVRDSPRINNRITERDNSRNRDHSILFRRESDNNRNQSRRSRVSESSIEGGKHQSNTIRKQDARTYEIRNSEDEPTESRNIKIHSRGNTHERSASVERVTLMPNSVVIVNRDNRISLNRHSNIVNRERDLTLQDERRVLLRQNSKVRNERSTVRTVERYDRSRDRVVERERNSIRYQIAESVLKRQITRTSEKQKTDLREERVSERRQLRETTQMRERKQDSTRQQTAARDANDKILVRHEDSYNRGSDKRMGSLDRDRAPSRQYKVFDFEPTIRMKDTASEPETKAPTLFCWQYLLYIIHGIYVVNIVLQIFRQKDKSINFRSFGLLHTPRHIKVE